MPIQWVPKKTINTGYIEKLMEKSVSSNQFTNGGPCVKLLEKEVRDILEIDSDKDVVAVSNGTVALWAAAAAIDLKENNGIPLRWATQAFTFPASAQGYLRHATIVDCDESGGMDLTKLNPDEIDGIIVTNIFGCALDLNKYEEWTAKYKKYLIIDNAATALTKLHGRNTCNYGHASTISFHHTKPIGFGEGGAIIINSSYSYSLRRIINFGIDNNAELPVWERIGGNYKMSDISAIYILAYLQKIDEIKNKHIELYKLFLQTAPHGVSFLPNATDVSNTVLSCMPLILPENTSLSIERSLLSAGVNCRKYYKPLLPLPGALHIYNSILCVPLTIDMTENDIKFIWEHVNQHLLDHS